MKLEILQKVITKIEKNIHCPQCKGGLKSKNMDLNFVQGSHVEFLIPCEKCHSVPKITVELDPKSLHQTSQPGTIDRKKLEQINSKMADFKGPSIHKLFE